MSALPAEVYTSFSPARRLRAIQARTSDPDLADLIDDVAAIEDRLLYAEAAVAHICDALHLDPHMLPDPLTPRLYVAPPEVAE